MPEIKHNFLKGRMNKDLDERLVPNGEYRNALNVEVSTSEDSNVGTVQTLKGNKALSAIQANMYTTCVGNIADGKNDKLYWFISEAGNRPDLGSWTSNEELLPKFGDFYLADLIAEYDESLDVVKPVVVDVYYCAMTISGYSASQGDGTYLSLNSSWWSGDMPLTIYPGMEIDCRDGDNNSIFPPGTTVTHTLNNAWQVRLSNPPINPTYFESQWNLCNVKFENFNRALNFPNKKEGRSNVITGINIVDDLLFWTDNSSEPKKINITKCKRERQLNYLINGIVYTGPNFNLNYDFDGGNEWETQSVLVTTDTKSSQGGVILANTDNDNASAELGMGLISPLGRQRYNHTLIPLLEEHTTVIKRSPENTLELEMRNTLRSGRIRGSLDYENPTGKQVDASWLNQTITANTTVNPYNPFWNYTENRLYEIGESVWIEFGGPDSSINAQPSYPNQVGSTGLAITCPNYKVGDVLRFTVVGSVPEEVVRAEVTNGPLYRWGGFSVSVLSGSKNVTDTDRVFDVSLEQSRPLFEFKFPRFSYRYKYEDGEYSAFAPFTEIAFLPSKFDYLPKKGYNLGMTNNLRKLVVKNFVNDNKLPKDVLSIDILYKESGSPNIYTVKTITRGDLEWDAISEDTLANQGERGYLKIESDLIHAILPSNQLLRPWDNVPRKALAQEITGNRLVYGNYLQNYDMRDVFGNPINITLELTSTAKAVGEENAGSFHYSPETRDAKNAYRYDPSKSVKSLRRYQLGVIYRDKYGRETPVFSTSTKSNVQDENKASLFIEKHLADQQVKLRAQIKNNPPYWAKSYKFFIKETSNEYYNLSMDRWYDAQDDNVWLSFPSSERNKVDIDTFLIFKKEKDSNNFVGEKARYKILAIENEAPTFIKTTEHSFGRVRDLTNRNGFRTDTGSVDTGFPREGFPYMYCEETIFKSMGWDVSLIDNPKTNLYMRMLGNGTSSNWYKVDGFQYLPNVGTAGSGSSGNYYRINIKNKLFGEDMNITNTNPTDINDSTIAGGLELEFKQNIIEHRAEFEGRFFVKIYKDSVIQERLIKPSLLDTQYVVMDARTVGYINTGANHNNPNDSWQQNGPAPSRNSGATNGTNWQWNYWSTSNPNPQAANTGGDNVMWDQTTGDAMAYWGPTKGWFIDAAVGFEGSWESGINGGQLYLSPAGSSSPKNIGGKGIYNHGRKINLSYTKLNGKVWGDGANNAYPIDLWEAGLNAEVMFISKLTTPGTLFRWKEDPDQHIYITTPGARAYSYGPGGDWTSNAMEFGILVYNSGDWDPSSAFKTDQWYVGLNIRNKFRINCKRLADDGRIGDPGGPHNARYTPVNNPKLAPYYNSNNIVLAAEGTCSDTAYNNQEQFCLDNGGTWTSAGGTNPTTPAPGIRGDFRKSKRYRTTNGQALDDFSSVVTWEILEPVNLVSGGGDLEEASHNPAMWETEPKEDVGMDIYHEVGRTYPIEIDNLTISDYIPNGSVVSAYRPHNSSFVINNPTYGPTNQPTPVGSISLGASAMSAWVAPIRVRSTEIGGRIILEDDNGNDFINDLNWPNEHIAPGDHLQFQAPDGSKVSAYAKTVNPTGLGNDVELFTDVSDVVQTLPWFNCYSFGNGVESDRVRDGFNQVMIDNGPKASTTLDEPYLEERRGSGFIWSGIYNSTSGINNLNQFIQAEKITKDLNPTYGSIQKLYSRDTDLVTLCEDKILKVLANKDALYNADGNTNLTATENVLGQTTPYVGDYGISKNPESFAAESFRAYFTDESRGAVLRLSRDGLTPISEVGMKDWFSDNLKLASHLIGSYDSKKSTYNLTFSDHGSTFNIPTHEIGEGNDPLPITISFSEKSKGWTSFKSFIPDAGINLNSEYYTFKHGEIWKHHDDSVERNSFYTQSGVRNVRSKVTVLLNEMPEAVKSFGTLNYEGSQARTTVDTRDSDYHNNIAIPAGAGLGVDNQGLSNFGWWVDSIKTDLQETGELEFKNKEGKWFSNIKGATTELSNIDTGEFSVQGIGNIDSVTEPRVTGCMDNTTVNGCGVDCFGALNYLPTASIACASCCVYCIWGCMTGTTTIGSQINSNYNPLATCDDDSCVPCVYGCTDNTYQNYDSSATCDDGSCAACIYGCTDSTAANYNSLATCDDGSCQIKIYGCTDDGTKDQFYWTQHGYQTSTAISTYPGVMASNYDSTANGENGTCQYISGCMDSTAINYNSLAVIVGLGVECTYCTYGCMDTDANNYNSNATCGDGTCIYPVSGCTDSIANNYNSSATIDDGSCSYTYGCMVTYAWNYDSNATVGCDNTTWGCKTVANWYANLNLAYTNPTYSTLPACTGPGTGSLGDCCVNEVFGCMDSNATNFDPLAVTHDGSCVYPSFACLESGDPDHPGWCYSDSNDTNSVQVTHEDNMTSCLENSFFWVEKDSSEIAAGGYLMWPNIKLGGGSDGSTSTASGWILDRWIEDGSLVWDSSTVYDQTFWTNHSAGQPNNVSLTSIGFWKPGNPMGNWIPRTFIKHAGVIYVMAPARENHINSVMGVPAGIEPGVTNPSILGHEGYTHGNFAGSYYEGNGTYWIPAEDAYNNDQEVRPYGCSRKGCMDLTQFNRSFYGNQSGCQTCNPTPWLPNTCIPIVFGCTDPTALNYYPAANVENGSCVMWTTGCTYGPNDMTEHKWKNVIPQALGTGIHPTVSSVQTLPPTGNTSGTGIHNPSGGSIPNGVGNTQLWDISVPAGGYDPAVMGGIATDSNYPIGEWGYLVHTYEVTTQTLWSDSGVTVDGVAGANNYDSSALADDGSCEFNLIDASGTTVGTVGGNPTQVIHAMNRYICGPSAYTNVPGNCGN